jgi:hypothetical protein
MLKNALTSRDVCVQSLFTLVPASIAAVRDTAPATQFVAIWAGAHPTAFRVYTRVSYQWRVYRSRLFWAAFSAFVLFETTELCRWLWGAPPFFDANVVTFPFAIPILAAIHVLRAVGPLLLARNALQLLTTSSQLRFKLLWDSSVRAAVATCVIEVCSVPLATPSFYPPIFEANSCLLFSCLCGSCSSDT